MNDNTRPAEVYEDKGFEILKKDKDYAFLKTLLKKRPAAAVGYCCDPTENRKINTRAYAEWRSLANFLWFIKFHHAWRKDEAERKRKEMEVVK